MKIADRVKKVIENHSSQNYTEQMKAATAGIPLMLEKSQLQMLIVLIENIGELEQSTLLELSDEEKAHINELYQRAAAAYEKHEKVPDSYTTQVDYLTKK